MPTKGRRAEGRHPDADRRAGIQMPTLATNAVTASLAELTPCQWLSVDLFEALVEQARTTFAPERERTLVEA